MEATHIIHGKKSENVINAENFGLKKQKNQMVSI